MNCTSLQSVHGAGNVKKIQDRAFKNTNLKEITLSKYIEKIGIGAFSCDDTSSRTIIFEGDQLPQISCSSSTSKLNSNLLEPVFKGNWTAVVPSKNIDFTDTIMDHDEFGYEGNIAIKDTNGNLSNFDTLETRRVAGKNIRINSTIEEWSAEEIKADISYDGDFRLTLSESSKESVEGAFRRVYGNKVPAMKVFDVSLEDASGVVNFTHFGNKPLSVTVPLPTEIKGNTVHVAALDSDGQLELVSSEIITQNGKNFVQFKTTHLSTFAIYALGEDGSVQIENGDVKLSAVSGRKDYSPNTGDYSIHPKWFVALALAAVAVALMSYKPRKRKA